MNEEPNAYIVDEVDYLELANRAVVTKQDHPTRNDAWTFDFSRLGVTTTDSEGKETTEPFVISAMGEHADTQEEAVLKVAARLAEGARSGDYSAPETREALANQPEESPEA